MLYKSPAAIPPSKLDIDSVVTAAARLPAAHGFELAEQVAQNIEPVIAEALNTLAARVGACKNPDYCVIVCLLEHGRGLLPPAVTVEVQTSPIASTLFCVDLPETSTPAQALWASTLIVWSINQARKTLGVSSLGIHGDGGDIVARRVLLGDYS